MTRRRRDKTNEQHVTELERHLTKRGPADDDGSPTPQRVERARLTGQTIRATIIHTDSGFPTGTFYWRITPIIDTLLRRGTLSDEEYDAALRYMRHYAGSRHKGPATSKLMPHYDRGFQELLPAERAMAMGQARARAEKAVHPFFRKTLRWLEAAAEDELPLWHLGALYYPEVSQSQQSSRAPVILHFTLGMLADHYGITGHRFSLQEIDQAVETLRVTIEYSRTYPQPEKKSA
jgi:hypothetical protein